MILDVARMVLYSSSVSKNHQKPSPLTREEAMMNSAMTAARTSESTDRTPNLTSRPTAAAQQPKSIVNRVGGAARRFLNNLMRSLATPHI
jgi:hypothetical protein